MIPGVLALLLGSCAGLAPGDAIHDLAAIHEPADWSPRSPAPMRLRPDSYLAGQRVDSPFRVGEAAQYEVADHRALELAILEWVWKTPPLDYGLSLEATGWLTIQLLQDEHPAARNRAAAVLGSFAAGWVRGAGARLPAAAPTGSLAAAAEAFAAASADPAAADTPQRAGAAAAAFDGAAMTDPLEAARLVAGLARRCRTIGRPLEDGGGLARIGLRTVLLALERGERDPDAEVAATCRTLRGELLAGARPD